MDQETALILQRIELELVNQRQERADDKRLLGSIDKRLGILNETVIKHEMDIRSQSGNHAAMAITVASHEKFVNDENGRRTVWHWVRGAISAVLLLLLGAALNTMRNFYIQQGSNTTDLADFSRRLTTLENRIFGTFNEEKK